MQDTGQPALQDAAIPFAAWWPLASRGRRINGGACTAHKRQISEKWVSLAEAPAQPKLVRLLKIASSLRSACTAWKNHNFEFSAP